MLAPSDEATLLRRLLIQFVTLLGTFKQEPESENENGPTSSYNEALRDLMKMPENDQHRLYSFPSLLLESESESHSRSSCCNKNRVEALEFGEANLARPIVVHSDSPVKCSPNSTSKTQNSIGNGASGRPAHTAASEKTLGAIDIHMSKVPRLMLDNLSASFSLLLHARLRAYGDILHRHEVSLAECPSLTPEEQQVKILAVEHKLAKLMETGSRTIVNTMVTYFRVTTTEDSPATEGIRTVEQATPTEKSILPITMETIMDISIPNLIGGNECITVSFRASGTITGSTEDDHLKFVQVNLDMHKLLESMIDRAGLVMSTVVEIVNAACNNQECKKLPRDTIKMSNIHLEKKRKHDGLPIVSPHLGSNRNSRNPSPLHLWQSEDTIDLPFSLEKCASIIDTAIGEIEFYPPKRTRITATVL